MSNFPGVVNRVAEAVKRRQIRLRYYQQHVKDQVIDHWGRALPADDCNVMAVMPTGAGKTVLFTDMTAEHTGAAVLIAHRQELVTQISLTLNAFGVRHRLICPDKVRKLIIQRHLKEHGVTFHDAGAMVGVGGVDTLVRIANKPQYDTWRRSVTFGVIDEGHHVLAENKWGKATLEFPACHRWLIVTATPERPDGQGLGRHAAGICDHLVVGPGMRELIDDGYLCSYKVWTVPHEVNYSAVKIGPSGEFVHATLVAAEDCDKKLVGNIVATYLKRVPGKRAICFMSSVKKAEETAEAFRQAGVPSVAVDGTSSDEERERATEDLADDKIKVLVNCDLVGEGVDVPAVEVVIMGTRTASFVRFTQWWGRMLRLALSEAARNGYDGLSAAGRRQRIAESDKPFGIVIDHGGNLIQHNGPPDLRTEPWSLDARQRRNTAGAEAIPYRVCPNYMELEAGLTWEQVRELGMSDAQLREAGMGWKAPNNWSCATPYAATNRCCPECGYMPLPVSRSSPQEVDGDLQLLDAEALLALRAATAKANETPGELEARLYASRLSAFKIAGVVNKHRQKLAVYAELVESMDRWAGIYHFRGETDSQINRRFYLSFGVDIESAQALDRQAAEKLKARIDSAVTTA